MKIKYRLLKIAICLGLLVFLMNFSLNRFENTPFYQFQIEIPDADSLGFIDQKIIKDTFYHQFKDTSQILMKQINVYNLESSLKRNPYVDSLNVYLDQDKILHFYVQQKSPVIRVNNGNKYYYITNNAEILPISTHFSKECLMVEGNIKEQDIPHLIRMQRSVNEDNLLKKHIVGVRKLNDNSFILLVNVEDFYVELGNLDRIEEKLIDLKAFYEQYLNHVGLGKYKKISLKYNNQIVATKK